jgi:hypothetical protein
MPSPGLFLNPVSTENVAGMILTSSELPVALWKLRIQPETTLVISTSYSELFDFRFSRDSRDPCLGFNLKSPSTEGGRNYEYM